MSSPDPAPVHEVPANESAPTESAGLWAWFVVCALAALSLDQLSKEVILRTLEPATPIPLIPNLFELRLVFNPGAAFSLFEGGRWMFISVSLGAILFLPYYLRGLLRQGERSPVYPIGLGLILGGAMGNAIDRVFRPEGLVVDFFHAYWGAHSFPVFNVADSAISVGLVLLLAFMIFAPVAAPPPMPAALESPERKEEGERDVAGSL